MANISSVRGARPVRHLDGSPYNGAVTPYLLDSGDGTATFVGDFVKLAGTTGASGQYVNGMPCHGMPTIQQAAAGDTLLGVVVGFLPDVTNLNLRYRTASTNRIALVADAPDLIFEIQEDAGGAATALVDVGENADIVVGSGNTTTGLSGMQLDSSDHKTATANLRILRFVPKPDNEPASAYAKLEVVINEHQFKTATGV
jgi:hypothetical protein